MSNKTTHLTIPDTFGRRTMSEPDGPNNPDTVQGAARQLAWILLQHHSTETYNQWLNYLLELLDAEITPTLPELYEDLLQDLRADIRTRLESGSW